MAKIIIAATLALLTPLTAAQAQSPFGGNNPRGNGLASVQHWSAAYGVSTACEIAIIDREDSTWDPRQPNLQGSGAVGLGQWMPRGIYTTSRYYAAGIPPESLSADQQVELIAEELANYGTSPWWPAPVECGG